MPNRTRACSGSRDPLYFRASVLSEQLKVTVHINYGSTSQVINFLLWASTSAASQPGLSSSNVLCFIAIVAILSFEQINHYH